MNAVALAHSMGRLQNGATASIIGAMVDIMAAQHGQG